MMLLEVLGLAFLASAATVLLVVIVMTVLLAVAYTLDHWDEFADTLKGLGLFIALFAAWAVIIGSYKYATTPVPENIQVEQESE